MCNCEQALELISLELDEMLDDGQRTQLDAHLADCPDCGAIARELLTLRQVMPQLEEEVPQGFHQRVMDKIAAEKMVAFPMKKTPSRWKAWASMAAAFALIVAGAGTALRWEDLAQQNRGQMNPMPAAMGTPSVALVTDDVPEVVQLTPAPQPSPLQDAAVANVEGQAVAPQEGTLTGKAKQAPATPVPVAVPTPLPTPAPTPSELVEQPRMVLRSAVSDAPAPTQTPGAESPMLTATYGLQPPATLSIEDAGQMVISSAYAGLVYESARRDDGAFVGYRVTDTDSVVELNYVGLSANGLYYEFTLLPQGGTEEWNRFAVQLDGGVVVALWETGTLSGPVEHRAEYDATVGN